MNVWNVLSKIANRTVGRISRKWVMVYSFGDIFRIVLVELSRLTFKGEALGTECRRGSPAGGELLYKVVFQYRFTVRLVCAWCSVSKAHAFTAAEGGQQADELAAEVLKLYHVHQVQPDRWSCKIWKENFAPGEGWIRYKLIQLTDGIIELKLKLKIEITLIPCWVWD